MTFNQLRSFPVGVAEELGSYVYLYVDPRDDRVFYVGKGLNERAFSHLNEADDNGRDSKKVKRIREIWDSGQEVIVRVHRHGMTPEQALHVEASLIEIFPDAENDVEGHATSLLGDRLISDLINEKQRERASIDFPAVLINIRKEFVRIRPNASKPVDPKLLYQSTRSAWEMKPSKHPSVRHAISVAFGIIREVYEIDEWLRADINGNGTSRQIDGRWMFVGKVATDKQSLLGKAIDHLQKTGAQNPIKWLDKGSEFERMK